MASTPPIPLSVLDIVPLRRGATAGEAFAESVALARHVEGLGYHRYWFAEHHGSAGIASAAPAVLAGQVAAATTTIRVGSGGVMLPNHASLTIAEQFGTLEAMFPGRIDLGLGRAPGTDGVTASALRRGADPRAGVDEFPEQLDDLFSFFRCDFPKGHPYSRIDAHPAVGNEPAVWLLGSSDFSARLAGEAGLPFSFAHHFSQENTLPALRVYRQAFQRSSTTPKETRLERPQAMVAALIVAADDDDTARNNALPMALAFLGMMQGKRGPSATLEEALAYPWTPPERRFVDDWMNKNIVGGPETVKKKLQALIKDTQADELMILSTAPDAESRRRSYSIIREVHGS